MERDKFTAALEAIRCINASINAAQDGDSRAATLRLDTAIGHLRAERAGLAPKGYEEPARALVLQLRSLLDLAAAHFERASAPAFSVKIDQAIEKADAFTGQADLKRTPEIRTPIGTADSAIAAVKTLRPKLRAGHWIASWVPGRGDGIGFWDVVYRANRKARRQEWAVELNADGSAREVTPW